MTTTKPAHKTTIELIRKEPGCIEVKITRDPVNMDWAVEAGRIPWCTVSLSGDEATSFGGEVWPAAWPDWFTHNKGSAQCPINIRLTDAGRSAIAHAEGRS